MISYSRKAEAFKLFYSFRFTLKTEDEHFEYVLLFNFKSKDLHVGSDEKTAATKHLKTRNTIPHVLEYTQYQTFTVIS